MFQSRVLKLLMPHNLHQKLKHPFMGIGTPWPAFSTPAFCLLCHLSPFSSYQNVKSSGCYIQGLASTFKFKVSICSCCTHNIREQPCFLFKYFAPFLTGSSLLCLLIGTSSVQRSLCISGFLSFPKFFHFVAWNLLCCSLSKHHLFLYAFFRHSWRSSCPM